MNTTKYVALAFSSPKGLEFRNRVEGAWAQWLQRVEGAPWLWNFKGSTLWDKQGKARTPSGVVVAGWPRYPHHAIADFVYATAVWGFGIEGRSPNEKYWEQEARRYQVVNSANPYGLCGTKTNVGLPLMFKELDEWLDSLWV